MKLQYVSGIWRETYLFTCLDWEINQDRGCSLARRPTAWLAPREKLFYLSQLTQGNQASHWAWGCTKGLGWHGAKLSLRAQQQGNTAVLHQCSGLTPQDVCRRMLWLCVCIPEPERPQTEAHRSLTDAFQSNLVHWLFKHSVFHTQKCQASGMMANAQKYDTKCIYNKKMAVPGPLGKGEK